MKVKVLASGSKGNSTFIESNGTRILVDVGVTFQSIKSSLEDIGENIYNLKQKISNMFNLDEIKTKDMTYLSNARSISILNRTLKIIKDCIINLKNETPIDIVEMDLKESWQLLGEIIGETYTDELIDEIFSRFCLGK